MIRPVITNIYNMKIWILIPTSISNRTNKTTKCKETQTQVNAITISQSSTKKIIRYKEERSNTRQLLRIPLVHIGFTNNVELQPLPTNLPLQIVHNQLLIRGMEAKTRHRWHHLAETVSGTISRSFTHSRS